MQWFSCKETLAKFEDRASQSKPQFISEIECKDHFEVCGIGSNSSKNHIIDSVEADILFPQSIYASYSFYSHISVNGDVVCTNLYACIAKKDYHVLTVDFERLEGTIWKKRFRGLEPLTLNYYEYLLVSIHCKSKRRITSFAVTWLTLFNVDFSLFGFDFEETSLFGDVFIKVYGIFYPITSYIHYYMLYNHKKYYALDMTTEEITFSFPV